MIMRTSLLMLADELLREYGQNSEYPYLTRERMRKIAAHEVIVADVDADIETLSAETGLDRLRVKDRMRAWESTV